MSHRIATPDEEIAHLHASIVEYPEVDGGPPAEFSIEILPQLRAKHT